MISCPICKNSDKIQSRGYKNNGKHQYFCSSEVPHNGSRYFVMVDTDEVSDEVIEKKAPKILLLDIETSRMLVNTFGIWEQNIPTDNIVKEWFIICFSYKWLYDDKVMNFCVTPKEAKNRDDKRIVKELWKLMDECDFLIGHNIKAFDAKKALARMVYYDMEPPSAYREIDSLLIARNSFNITSNKLDYLGEYFGLGRKIANEKGLWNKVENGDVQSLIDMTTYCDQDVQLLENIYLRMRPYAKNQPNLSAYGDSDSVHCPVCFAEDSIEWHDTKMYDNKYKVGRCSVCHAPVRSKKNEMLKDKKKSMTVRG